MANRQRKRRNEMAKPVVTVASGGIPVVDVTATTPKLGIAVSEAAKGGLAVTKVAAGKPGIAVTYVVPTIAVP